MVASGLLYVPAGAMCVASLPGRLPMLACVVWWQNGLLRCGFTEAIGTVTYDAILKRRAEPRR
jgi:hypothetical protein